jgi:hypothetical protein
MSKAIDSTTTIPTRRALLAGAPAVAAAAVAGHYPAIAAVGEPDPIFAVIAEHQAAMMAYWNACKACAESLDCDEDEHLEKVVDETCAAHFDARDALFACRPTTLAGVVALLSHLAEPDYGHDPKRTVLAVAMRWNATCRRGPKDFQAFLPRCSATSPQGGRHEHHHSRSDLRCHRTRATGLCGVLRYGCAPTHRE